MTTTTAPFRSILFDPPADAAASAGPSVLTDLNLDQVFTAVAGRDEYGLRRPDGQRTFRLLPGEPLPTSCGEDLYQEMFEAADQQAQV